MSVDTLEAEIAPGRHPDQLQHSRRGEARPAGGAWAGSRWRFRPTILWWSKAAVRGRDRRTPARRARRMRHGPGARGRDDSGRSRHARPAGGAAGPRLRGLSHLSTRDHHPGNATFLDAAIAGVRAADLAPHRLVGRHPELPDLGKIAGITEHRHDCEFARRATARPLSFSGSTYGLMALRAPRRDSRAADRPRAYRMSASRQPVRHAKRPKSDLTRRGQAAIGGPISENEEHRLNLRTPLLLLGEH